MSTTFCPGRDELLEYALGCLPEANSDSIAQHLDKCDRCQAELATLDGDDDTLVARLRGPAGADPIVAESHCAAAVERAKGMTAAIDKVPSSAERSLPSESFEQLGEYQLMERLGSGGMGKVYKAFQTKLDRTVALKILPSGRADDERAIARFEREMKAIGRLDHPNVVRAYDAREIDGKLTLVMELVDGFDLARIVRLCGPLPVADACETARQAALGLAYAHENGLIHRDVKPSNLMLTRTGQVKVLDLGLARFHGEPSGGEEMTGDGQPMGTADYMAPEQVSDSRAVDIRADIYGLGCTLFTLLTGRPPYAGPEFPGTFEKLTAHVNQPAPLRDGHIDGVPRKLIAVLDRMLAKSPDDRFATPAEVASALEPFCEGHNLKQLAVRGAEREADQGSDWSGVAGAEDRFDRRRLAGHATSPGAVRTGWFWGLIAAGLLLAGAGGFALGVIITIERNGKKTSLEVPDGSGVKVSEKGDVEVKLPGQEKSAGLTMEANDFDAIQGTWKVVGQKGKAVANRGLLRARTSATPEGSTIELWKTSRFVITKDRIVIRGPHELPTSYEYDINPDTGPKMIDLFVNNDELLGVYELDDDQLKLCFDWSGHLNSSSPNVRPTAVWAGLDSDQEMLVLQRVGPVEADPDERGLLGTWEIVSASTKITDRFPGMPETPRYAAPVGTLAAGRRVWITPSEFIIKGAPMTELPANRNSRRSSYGGAGLGMPGGGGGGALGANEEEYGGGYGEEEAMYGGMGMGMSGLSNARIQPLHHDDAYQYALDPSMHPKWISFSRVIGTPCPGIYRLDKDRLKIRLGKTSRPRDMDAPPGKDEVVVELKRVAAGNTGDTAIDRSSRAAGDDSVQKAQAEPVTSPGNAVTARLDFRIAVTREATDQPATTGLQSAVDAEHAGLSEREVQQYIDQLRGSESGASTNAEPPVWFPLAADAAGNVPKNPALVTATKGDQKFVLLHDGPDSVMLAKDQGRRAWRVVTCSANWRGTKLPPSISIGLDAQGGQRMRDFTARHFGEPLAVLVNDQVLIIPTIRSVMRQQLDVTGDFDKATVDRLMKVLVRLSTETKPADLVAEPARVQTHRHARSSRSGS